MGSTIGPGAPGAGSVPQAEHKTSSEKALAADGRPSQKTEPGTLPAGSARASESVTSLTPGDARGSLIATKAAALVIGPNNSGSTTPPDADASARAKLAFEPLVALLSEPKTPGQKFAFDGLSSPAFEAGTVPFKQAAWLVRQLDPAPANSDANAQLRIVKQYQTLVEKTYTSPHFEALLATRCAAMPPAARARIHLAVLRVAELGASFRAADRVTFRRPVGIEGKREHVRQRLERAMTELSAGPIATVKDTDIEIPGLDVLAAETLGRDVTVTANVVATAVAEAINDGALGRDSSGTPIGHRPKQTAASPLDTIDWQNTSVETLLQLVLMQGFKAESEATRDLLRGMVASNKQKEQLRKLSTEAKQQNARLESQMQNEFNAFRASGAISDKVTFDQYKTWREFDFGGLAERIDENGARDYSLPAPQLKAISASDLPAWMPLGEVEQAKDAGQVEATQKSFGLEPSVDTQLRAIFEALRPDDLSYPQWLQQEIGLRPVATLNDITQNISALKSYLQRMDAPAIDRATQVATTGNVNAPLLGELQDAYRAMCKAEMLRAALPEIVSAKVVAEARAAFNAIALRGSQANNGHMDAATASTFNEWKATEATNELREYRNEVDAFTISMKSPASYQGQLKRYDGDSGWSDETWNDLYSNGQSLPGAVSFVTDANGNYTLVKTVEADMGALDRDKGFLENLQHAGSTVVSVVHSVKNDGVAFVKGLFNETSEEDIPTPPDVIWKVECPYRGSGSAILADINALMRGKEKPDSVMVIDARAYDGLHPEMSADGLSFTIDGERITVSWTEFTETVGKSAGLGALVGGTVGLGIGAAGGTVAGGVVGGIVGGIAGGVWNFGLGTVPGAIVGAMCGIFIGACCGMAIGGLLGGTAGVAIGTVAGTKQGIEQAKREKLVDYINRMAKTGDSVPMSLVDGFAGKSEDARATLTDAERAAQVERSARVQTITAALTGLASALGALGDVEQAGTRYHTWARAHGLDGEWNETQAEARRRAGLPPIPPTERPLDSATGLRLTLRGNLAFFEAKVAEIDDKLESAKSLSEVESMSLQRQMERQSKLLETLSNVMKAISQTTKTITDNLR